MVSLSLREFLNTVKNYVTYDKEVSWNLEATKIIVENEGRPVLFKRISSSQYPLVANVLYSRKALYDLLDARSDEEVYLKFLKALSKPRKLSNGTIYSSYTKLKHVDMSSMPILKFYPEDGGRYVTSAIVLAGDGEGNFNASVHRLMLVNKNKFAIRIVPRHLYSMLIKFKKLGKNMPVVVLIGTHPLIMLSSAFSPPYGVYEIEVANSVSGGIIKADYLTELNIPTPLVSEMIWVGEISAFETHSEGPFVDILGTYDIIREQPVLHVKEVWVREEAIFQEILPGGIEHKLLMGFPREVAIWDAVRKVVPKVKSIRLTPGGAGWLHAVISIEKQTEGDGKNAILAAFAAHPSLKHVVVVDTDIDVDRVEDVEWAIATRFRADRDLIVIENIKGSTLDPVSENGLTAKMGLDATIPLSKLKKLFEKARLD
ncbi:MAG: UbiD family decarboxylase [Desulfurococcales archaeon ex4484_217_1]|nr:MAG: UbiD family decarboxylase [Desulfurococcales archaeon ex4484_217_1]